MRASLAGALAAATVVGLPGAGSATALDGCGARVDGTASTARSASATTGSTTVASSTARAGAAGGAVSVARTDAPTDPTDGGATDGPSSEDRPTDAEGATATDPGVDDPSDPTTSTPSDPGGTESPEPTDGSAEPVSLSVEAVASSQVVEQGDTVTYTITVSNAGPGDDPGVSVNSQLPEGFDVEDVVVGEDYDIETGMWDVGGLLAGKDAKLVLQVHVTSEPDQVAAGPTVTGEATDAMPFDDQTCTMILVEPSSRPRAGGGSDDGGPGDGSPTAGPGAAQPGPNGSKPDDPTTAGADPTTTSPRPGGPGDDGTDGTTPPGEAAGSDRGTGASAEAETRSDVSSARTSTDAALLMLAWMLVAAGVVLLLLGRIRHRKQPSWYV